MRSDIAMVAVWELEVGCGALLLYVVVTCSPTLVVGRSGHVLGLPDQEVGRMQWRAESGPELQRLVHVACQ